MAKKRQLLPPANSRQFDILLGIETLLFVGFNSVSVDLLNQRGSLDFEKTSGFRDVARGVIEGFFNILPFYVLYSLF